MKKNQFVFRIFKNVSSSNTYHKLVIQVETLTGGYDDGSIEFTWQANANDEKPEWYACSINCSLRAGRFVLLPIISRLSKSELNSSSTPQDVIVYLQSQKIEQATYIALDNGIDRIFNGIVSLSELQAGKFNRYYTNREFKLTPEKQVSALHTMLAELNFDIPVKKLAQVN